MLVPKLISCLKTYSWKTFSNDLIAGLVVGVVALPLAMAFAIGSGVRPEQGLFTAIVAGFLISALGGSRVQIGGPTGAFVVIVFGIVREFGYDGLAIATLMAGLILIFMGVSRLGGAVKFIPYPVTLGFTAGIAVVIFSGQIKDLLGIHDVPDPENADKLLSIPPDFFGKCVYYFQQVSAGNFDWATIGLSAGCLAVLILWPRFVSRRVPAPLVAMVLATIAAYLLSLNGVNLALIGDIPTTLPAPRLPDFSNMTVQRIGDLMPKAVVIAILAAIESLLSAVVADGMMGGRHRPNMELVAQGVANFFSPIFGGIPATGAIARTATNVKSGAKTPVAGMVHALTLLVILMVFGPLAKYVPRAVLACVLVIVCYSMAEIHKFLSLVRPAARDAIDFVIGLVRHGKARSEPLQLLPDASVLLVTFLLTVIFDLVVAVEVGLMLAAVLFIKRMADVTNIQVVTRELSDPNGEGADPNAISSRQVPQGVEVYEVNGPFFFGVADKVRDVLRAVAGRTKVFILRMRYVPAMDASGLYALLELRQKCASDGCTLILSEIHTQPFIALDRSGHREEFGEDNVTAHIDDALNQARKLLGLPVATTHDPRVPEVARDRKADASGVVRVT
jgi:SulP family sulfate permease